MFLYSLIITTILFINFYIIGKVVNKLVPKLKDINCTIFGIVFVFGLFQIITYIGIPINLNTIYYLLFASILLISGPILAIIFKVSIVPNKNDLMSFLFGIIASIILCLVSAQLNTNNIFFDSNYYMSRVIESSTSNTLAHVNFYSGKFLFGIDIFHDYQGSYYFWGMILKGFRKITGISESLTPIYIWSASLTYYMSLGMLCYSSIIVMIKKINYKAILITFFLLPYFTNYFNSTLAFFGNSMKTIIIGFSMLLLYLYIKEKDNKIFVLLFFSYLGGLSFSSSSFFIFVFISIGFFLYLILSNNTVVKNYQSWFFSILPLFHYLLLLCSPWNINNLVTLFILSILIVIAILVFYLIDKTKEKTKLKIIKYIKIVSAICVSIIIVVSFILRNNIFGYLFYFEFRSLNDMTLNYTNSINILELMRNLILWIILFMIVFSRKIKDEFRYFLLIMGFLFLTPLTSPFIATFLTNDVYSRIFEVIANPFVLTYVFVVFSEAINNKVFNLIITITFSLISLGLGLYNCVMPYSRVLLNNNEEYNWEYKTTMETYDLYTYILENISKDEVNRPIFISQDIGLKAYISNVEIVFDSSDLRSALENRKDIPENTKNLMELFNPQRVFYTDTIFSNNVNYESMCEVVSMTRSDYLILKANVFQPNNEGNYVPVWWHARGCADVVYENEEWVLLEVR